MYNKKNLVKDLKRIGVYGGRSNEYGKSAVIKLKSSIFNYMLVYESNIDDAFWGVTRSVIGDLKNNNEQYITVFIDSKLEKVYAYDEKQIDRLLATVSYEKKYGNYKLKRNNLTNPVDYNNFYGIHCI